MRCDNTLNELSRTSGYLQFPKSEMSGGCGRTGLSMEVGGVSLATSPTGVDGSRNSSTPVKKVKQCLDFDVSDCSTKSAEVWDNCAEEQRNVCDRNVVNCVDVDELSTAGGRPNCDGSRPPKKKVVIHSSMPSMLQAKPDDLASVTLETNRSHQTPVCPVSALV